MALGQETQATIQARRRLYFVAEWLRIGIAGASSAIAYTVEGTGLLYATFAYLAVAFVWLFLNWGGLVDQQRRPGWAYVPASIDLVSTLTFTYMTGMVGSPFVMGLIAITAVSSMTTITRQGLFNTAGGILLYSLLAVGVTLGWLPKVNVIGSDVPSTITEMVTWILLFAAINTATHRFAQHLAHSEARARQDLLAREEELRESRDELRRVQAYIENDLRMARQIQEHILPLTPPKVVGANFVSEYITLDQVGGDFLDYAVDREGGVGILVADASGHGVSAALVATVAKGAMESLRAHIREPEQTLRGLNAAVIERLNGHFFTACYAYFDSDGRELIYSLGGHPPPFVFRPGRPAEMLDGRGSLLGLVEEPKLDQWRVQLTAGDRILFVTDGILELRDSNNNMLDLEQFTSLLTGVSGYTTEHILKQLLIELKRFAGPGEFEDDVTMVLLDVLD